MVIGRLAIRKILEKANAYDWSLQGLGMFRLSFSKEIRLHVWDLRFAFPEVSQFHTHPWDFESWIVSGSLTDRTYKIIDGFPTHHCQTIRCGPGGCAIGRKEDVCLRLAHEITLGEGESYLHNRSDIHHSIPRNGTVSVITRTFYDDTEHADVFVPFGKTWVSAEPRSAKPLEIRKMAELALFIWDEELYPNTYPIVSSCLTAQLPIG